MAKPRTKNRKQGRGAPPVFATPEELERKVDQYFVWIEGEQEEVEQPDPNDEGGFIKQTVWKRHPEPPTITGLCSFLGFESRQSFYDYKQKTDFSYAIKRARLRIECEYEKRLHSKTPTGAIFALKNLGWADRQEVDHTTAGMPIQQHEVVFKDYSKPKKK